jgi:LysM repeat protein
LKVHQAIRKYVQICARGSSITAVALVFAVLFVGVTFLMNVTKASAQVYAPCSHGDQAYKITQGDTLGSIASRFGTTWSVVASHNHIAQANLIYPGQQVCIPGRKSARSASSTVTLSRNTSNVPVGSSIETMITRAFGPYAPGAVNIARCESGLNPAAYNPYSGASGLFQIIPGTWAGTSQAHYSPFNAQANIAAAHEIFVRDGYSWREWTCRA